jgi:selenocysteine lyase/cysteine desulfurase
VKLSIRKGVLRMSLGLYNDASDVDRFLALVRDWLGVRR